VKVFYANTTSAVIDGGVVWTNGCYDILHVGHVRLFEHCRKIAEDKGCSFFVGIDSDRRVKQMKGPSRPINTENDRAEFLLSMKGIDRVYIYDTPEELEKVIGILKPEVMVVGDEYKTKTVIGSSFSKAVVFFPKIVGYSTSNTLSKID
jgi:D-beta-D-heptose 7-phosphate kinase/D-beta-D-heptose 1-phosphate adenosyltransferase